MLRSERMLNIEKYKEELENIGVINPNGLAVIDGKLSVICASFVAKKAVAFIKQIIGYSQNTKNQKLTGLRLKLIHQYWLKTS